MSQTDAEKIALIRAAMPVTQTKTYLNTGTCGPLSTLMVETLNRENSLELAEGRADKKGFEALHTAAADLRAAIARLVNATPAEIALTSHTTNGMNIVAHGFNWLPGDEIVTTTLEHQGGLLPVYVLRQRYGVAVRMVELSAADPAEEIVAKLEAAITPRTRLLVFSHVAWNTGQRLPLARIAAMGHRYRIPSLVDAAQSAGAVALDLPASGVDFYAMPGQKWLCGPEGLGALYVRKSSLSLLNPTFIGYASLTSGADYDFTGYFMPAPDARRFEVGSVNRPSLKAMLANMLWLEETVGWSWIYDRIATLAEYARAALAMLPGVTVITPPGPQAGLISFNLAGYDPARVALHLAQKGIIIRFLPYPYVLRASTGFYNTPADIDRLVAELKTILAADPDALPR